MSTKFQIAILSGTLLALGAAASTPAAADDDQAEMEALVKAGQFISPDEAREKALAAKPGSVIDIDLDRGWRGGYHYEVEVLDADLREWEVHIDAKTGKVGKIERDWFD
jgi:uncharacterized membrane protein YkoI